MSIMSGVYDQIKLGSNNRLKGIMFQREAFLYNVKVIIIFFSQTNQEMRIAISRVTQEDWKAHKKFAVKSNSHAH